MSVLTDKILLYANTSHFMITTNDLPNVNNFNAGVQNYVSNCI
jgi:hypothetical protein